MAQKFCDDCIKGVRHEGELTGKLEYIADIECYIATPNVDYPKDTVLLFLPDAFGLPLNNNKLLSDDFANNGFKVVMPDIYNGDPVPDVVLTSGKFDTQGWLSQHDNAQTRPVIDKVIDALKAQGVANFVAVGYCFGARYVFDLAFERLIKVAAVAHPSFLKVPEDLDRYAKEAKAPLLINACEFDQAFPLAAQEQADSILGKGDFASKFKQLHWEGCTHGFAVRGDMSDPKVKAGKEGAFTSTVEWMRTHLNDQVDS